MIDRNSLSTNTLTNVTQHVVGGVEGRYLERLLTEFVSAIEKDPERENRLEAVKLRVRALQTQATISSGLILAFSAIAYSIAYWIATPQAIGLLYGAVALLLASVVFSFIYMHGLASTIAVNIERPRNRAERIFEFIYYALSISGIGLGLALFLIFLFLNMP